MSGLFLDRSGGRLALYMDGDLQFDSADERLYHEPLARLPVSLAAARFPGRGLRVLILGGGDGLALREVLGFPQVAQAHLVERDARVLELGAGELAGLNRGAFSDPRARVHRADARDFLPRASRLDALIFDLTYPSGAQGASLLSRESFLQARRALRPGGVLAVNAVSPEKTPEAFACIAATLEAAGLRALPFTREIPSFLREGYGRWGFFIASTRPLPEDAIRPEARLLPAGFPASAAANRSDELLYYLYNARPLAWEPPFQPVRFRPLRERGARLTAAQGFADWLAAPKGKRTLEELLRCLPLSRREQTRGALLDWSQQARALWSGLDLRAFLDAALSRARELPKGWARELRGLKARLGEGLPDLNEVLAMSYRVLAIVLIVLLTANLFFPDNLYAKGFSSHYGGGGGGGDFSGFSFSRPYSSPYRSYGHTWGRSSRPGTVFDSSGRSYPTQMFSFTDRQGGRKPLTGVLALSAEMQLLDSGLIAYKAGPPGFRLLLEPGRLRVLSLDGKEALALLPSPALVSEARGKVLAQGPLLDKAMEEHRLWLDWISYAPFAAEAGDARSEMEGLKSLRQAISNAESLWRDPKLPPSHDLQAHGFSEIFPGVWIESVFGAAAPKPRLGLVGSDGVLRVRPVGPPARLTDEDRFVFGLLQRRFVQGDERLHEPLAAWAQAFGPALQAGEGGAF